MFARLLSMLLEINNFIQKQQFRGASQNGCRPATLLKIGLHSKCFLVNSAIFWNLLSSCLRVRPYLYHTDRQECNDSEPLRFAIGKKIKNFIVSISHTLDSNLWLSLLIKDKKSLFRSSRPEVFLRIDALEICSKFTEEHPCRSAISMKLLCNFFDPFFIFSLIFIIINYAILLK